MASISELEFVELVRGLSSTAFVAFVADLWAARGYDTEVDGRVVVATDPGSGSRRTLVCLDEHERNWLSRLRQRGGGERHDENGRREADVVVVRGRDRSPGDTAGQQTPTPSVVDERELRRIALYAVDRAAVDALFRRYFDRGVADPDTSERDPETSETDPETSGPTSSTADRSVGVGTVVVALVALSVAVALLGVGFSGAGDLGPDAGSDGDMSTFGATPTQTATAAPLPSPVGVQVPTGTVTDEDVDDGEGNGTGAGAGDGGGFGGDVPRFAGDSDRASWSTFRATADRTGVARRTTGPRATVRVVGRLDRPAGAPPIASSPAVVDGNAFFGAGDANPNDGLLSRVTLDPVEPQWTVGLGSAVTSSPAVDGETVYVGSTRDAEAADRDFFPDANLWAVNATSGHLRWGAVMGPVERSSPVVVDDTVYVGSTDGRVYAVWATNGSSRWDSPAGDTVVSSPAVSAGTLYVGGGDGRLYAFDAATGAERWNVSLANRITSTPAVTNGTVYVGSEDGDVTAVDAGSGSVRWTRSTGGRVTASPAVHDGTVFVGSYDGRLYGIDAGTGTVRWRVATGAPVFASAAVAADTVYVGDVNGTVHAVDADTGDVLWTFATGDRLLASPAVADGRLLVATVDRLYVLAGSAVEQSSDLDQSHDAEGSVGVGRSVSGG